MKRKGLPYHGWILIDKPLGLSSAAVVAKVKRGLNAKKVGHAGTLDPLASGLLPLALGEATKTISYAMDAPKTYQFTIQFGAETQTCDAEGDITERSEHLVKKEALLALLPSFTGEISQTPPAYSAIKIQGQRAYALARAGEEVILPSRNIQIEALTCLEINLETQQATLECRCSKGTYIRSLARDIGRQLGALGHVVFLRRTAVGPFLEKDAQTLDSFLDSLDQLGYEEKQALVLPVETVLDDILVIVLQDTDAARFKNGNFISSLSCQALSSIAEQDAVLVSSSEQPLGLGIWDGTLLKPLRVFNYTNT